MVKREHPPILISAIYIYTTFLHAYDILLHYCPLTVLNGRSVMTQRWIITLSLTLTLILSLSLTLTIALTGPQWPSVGSANCGTWIDIQSQSNHNSLQSNQAGTWIDVMSMSQEGGGSIAIPPQGHRAGVFHVTSETSKPSKLTVRDGLR